MAREANCETDLGKTLARQSSTWIFCTTPEIPFKGWKSAGRDGSSIFNERASLARITPELENRLREQTPTVTP